MLNNPANHLRRHRLGRRTHPHRRHRPSEIIGPRTRELRHKVMDLLSADSTLTIQRAWELAVCQPASRWWISEERAAQAIGWWMKHPVTDRELTPRERCYADLTDRYTRRLAANPELTCQQFVRDIIDTPAPEYYLSANTARKISLQSCQQH